MPPPQSPPAPPLESAAGDGNEDGSSSGSKQRRRKRKKSSDSSGDVVAATTPTDDSDDVDDDETTTTKQPSAKALVQEIPALSEYSYAVIGLPPSDATENVRSANELRIATEETTGALGTVSGAMRTFSLAIPDPAALTPRTFTE